MSMTFSISIVSHGHKKYIEKLVEDLVRLDRSDVEVILTLNIPENLAIDVDQLPFRLKVIQNSVPKGFAANHNSAFGVSQGDNFVVLNPDIKLLDDPFGILLSLLEDAPDSICAPLILNEQYEIEDSARNFPSPFLLCKKVLSRICGFSLAPEVLRVNDEVIMPDWVAGMFILVPRRIYTNLHGLSERYYMYYEDVDLCARARVAGYKILVSKTAKAIHEAQRDSHRKMRYLFWHIGSALKFFTSSAYLKISLNRMLGVSPRY